MASNVISPETDGATAPLLQASATLHIAAPASAVYSVVSDLGRSSEWSPECRGGDWVSGQPGQVGSIFEGHNNRRPEVVEWAPVVRGDWTTRSVVVEAEPGTVFRWAMLDSHGNRQESVWTYRVRPAGEGSELTHEFWMGKATEGIGEITGAMSAQDRERFFIEWGEKIQQDLVATLDRLQKVIQPPR